MLLLLIAITLLSICNAFSPSSSIQSPSSISQRRITNININNGIGGGSNINILTSSSKTSTQLNMAQRMTPTRKTRKEDSFDRGQNDDKEEEGNCLLCVVCVLMYSCGRRGVVYGDVVNFAHILCSFFININHLNNSLPQLSINNICPIQNKQHTII